MPTDPPDNLLKSALEKVVYFECRIEQLERDLEGMTGERDRLKADLAAAAARELALRQELATSQSALHRANREADDWKDRAGKYKAEREQWLGKMIDLERIRTAGDAQPDGVDLASFIADLRAEVASLREGRPLERNQAPREPSPRDAAEAAVRMEKAGRIGITDSDRSAMVRSARFETRAEETVFAFSLRELSSPYAEGRTRAAERLKALGTREAAAALAAALNHEAEPAVRPALIDALAATAGREALPLLGPHLRAPEVTVRLAALEAVVKLAGEEAKAEVDRALGDDSPRVRRRAALLAGSLGATAGAPLLARASGDADAGVRRVAALSLATFGGETARRALLAAADDEDLSVRRAACQSLARLFGEPLLGLAEEPAARRRRELRRLEGAPLPELALVPAPPPAPAPAPVAAAPALPEVQVVELEAVRLVAAEPAPQPHRGASQREPEVDTGVDRELQEQVIAEVATSLRGRSLEELTALGPEAHVAQAAAQLMGQGRLVRRNQRFFLA